MNLSAYDFLFGVKRIDEKCFDMFMPYYKERARNYLFPVFYQSIVQMIAAGGFYYKIFRTSGRSTLAVFKRSSIMGNYSVMLQTAPISLTGDKRDELDIMQTSRRVGISLKVCHEDIRRYGIPGRLCQPIKGNVEYIYDANECYAAEGGKFHNFRRQRNKITNREGYAHKYGVTGDIDDLVEKWDRHNHASRNGDGRTSQTSDWKNIRRLTHENVHVHSIYVDNSLECFSVIEKLTARQWVLVMGMRDYDSPLNDVNVCMHWLDCEMAHDTSIAAVYANMGASLGISGLEAAKEKLRPCARTPIYRIAATNKLETSRIKSLFAYEN